MLRSRTPFTTLGLFAVVGLATVTTCSAQATIYVDDLQAMEHRAAIASPGGVAYAGGRQVAQQPTPYAVQQTARYNTPGARQGYAAQQAYTQQSRSVAHPQQAAASGGPSGTGVLSSLGSWSKSPNARQSEGRRGAPRGARGRQQRSPSNTSAYNSPDPFQNPAALKPSQPKQSGWSKWTSGWFGGDDTDKLPANRLASNPRAGAPQREQVSRAGQQPQDAAGGRANPRGGISAIPRNKPQGGLLSGFGWGSKKETPEAPNDRAMIAAAAATPRQTPRALAAQVPSATPSVAAERTPMLPGMSLPTKAASASSDFSSMDGMVLVSDETPTPAPEEPTEASGPKVVVNEHAAEPELAEARPAVESLVVAAAAPEASPAKTQVKSSEPSPALIAKAVEAQPTLDEQRAEPAVETVARAASAEGPSTPILEPESDELSETTDNLADVTPVAEPTAEAIETMPTIVAAAPVPAIAVAEVVEPAQQSVAADSQPLDTPLPLDLVEQSTEIEPTAPADESYEAVNAYAATTEEEPTKNWVIIGDTPRLPPRREPGSSAEAGTAEAYLEPAELEPTARARDLLTEARELGQDAHNTDDYLAVVQRCRYALAIDKSPQAADYANELAAWALTKRGELLSDDGRLAEAEVDFLEALRCKDDCWRAVHNLGILAAQAGEIEVARERFMETIALNPEYAKAYSNLGALSVVEGDFERAVHHYENAIEIDPDLGVAHAGRGRVCHMLGELDQALRHLDAAALLAPEDGAIALSRGDLLVDLGRYGLAKRAYERAILIAPEDPTAHRNLAWMLATCPVEAFRNGNAALEYAAEAERLVETPDDILLDTTAAALAAIGRFEEATEVVREAIQIAPEPDASEYRRRLALYERGEAFTTQPVEGVRQASHDTSGLNR